MDPAQLAGVDGSAVAPMDAAAAAFHTGMMLRSKGQIEGLDQ